MTPPLVDVLLATYNGARYLEPQLDSLLRQANQCFRLLVSDDGSTDATLDIVRRYRAAFGERLVLLDRAAPNVGAVRNFERLMQASLTAGQAKWVAFCDQDDVWLPHKMDAMLQAMWAIERQVGAHKPCLVHSDLVVVDASLRLISPSYVAYQRTQPGDFTPVHLLSVNPVTGCTAMVNQALLKMALPLPPEVVMHDWWCALISGSGMRHYMNEPLVQYRQHGSNQLGARDRGLRSRLLRLVRDAGGEWQHLRALGHVTRAQAMALQQRLSTLGLDARYVADYLAWRERPLLWRLKSYRRYFCGPELDRLARCVVWG